MKFFPADSARSSARTTTCRSASSAASTTTGWPSRRSAKDLLDPIGPAFADVGQGDGRDVEREIRPPVFSSTQSRRSELLVTEAGVLGELAVATGIIPRWSASSAPSRRSPGPARCRPDR